MLCCERVRRFRGFSLIEVLLVVGILGILIALVLPALSSARGAARETVCLSNLSGIGVVFALYHAGHREVFPFARAGTPLGTSPPDPGLPGGFGSSIQVGHWDLSLYWASLMHDVAPWPEFWPAWICRGSDREPGTPWRFATGLTGIPSYLYSRSFIADPEVWNPAAGGGGGGPPTIGRDDSRLRAVRLSEVQHPSRKVLVFDWEVSHRPPAPQGKPDPRPMLFVDGHAAVRRLSQANPLARNLVSGQSDPLHDTPWGVRGTDY